MTDRTREAEYRSALLWAFDRLGVDDGMSAREQRHTMIELGKVLTGKSSPAARYHPKEWADSARLVSHGEGGTTNDR